MFAIVRSSGRAMIVGLALTLALLACGCGSGGASRVSGQVTFDGASVEEGRILFRSQADGRAYSTPIKNGTYSLECVPGEMRVEITASRLIPGKFDISNGTPEPVGVMYIPTKYNSASTLVASVKAGGNKVPFTLTSR